MKRRVYVAGPINAIDLGRYRQNVRNGLKTCSALTQRGYAVFCPFSDFLLEFFGEISQQMYYESDESWLSVSEALFIVPDSEWYLSEGVMNEIRLANSLGIPVFHDMDALDTYFADSKKGGQ